ncbi:MAG: sigma-70 family RNA polymerase sigma factor [Verrucomicrobiota bacterium]
MKREEIINVLLSERTKLVAFGWSLLRDSHAAEDVYQELMVKVLDREREFEGPKHLKAWSWTVVRNRCYELVRQKNYRQRILEDSILDLVDQNLEQRDPGEVSDRVEALRGCLARLTDNARNIVRLRYFEGMSGKEVAEALDRKTDAVYKALQRIYATLAGCIEEKLEAARGGSTA